MKKKQKALKHQNASKRSPSSKASTSLAANLSKSIRIEKRFPLPAFARDALNRLNEAGYIAYVVGGSVRDFLLNREIKDHDIATSANPDEVMALFPNAVTVGKQFGVIKVPTGTIPPLLEIATFREDLEYKDHRHPKGVVFSGPWEDAQRRDFTINSLFFDPKTSRVIDATGGLEDLQARVIRAIGDPDLRFKEDALRLLRAIRFTTRLGFKLDPKTSEAVKEKAKLISRVSPERIRDELTLMWTGPNAAESLKLLASHELLRVVLPEVDALRTVPPSPAHYIDGDVWAHTLKVLGCVGVQNAKVSTALGWASVLIDAGKVVASRLSGGKNFNGHEIEGAKIAKSIALRMKMSRDEMELIAWMLEEHMKFRDVFKMREATLQRFISQPHFAELLALHKADATASDGNLAFYEFCQSKLQARGADLAAPKLIDGTDLIQLGLKPGPEFSEILRVVEDMALEKRLHSKEEALEYVVKYFVR